MYSACLVLTRCCTLWFQSECICDSCAHHCSLLKALRLFAFPSRTEGRGQWGPSGSPPKPCCGSTCWAWSLWRRPSTRTTPTCAATGRGEFAPKVQPLPRIFKRWNNHSLERRRGLMDSPPQIKTESLPIIKSKKKGSGLLVETYRGRKSRAMVMWLLEWSPHSSKSTVSFLMRATRRSAGALIDHLSV